MKNAISRALFDELTRTPPLSAFSRRTREGPIAFDERITGLLEQRYSSDLDKAIGLLANLRFDFDSMANIHSAQLRRPLLARQAFPYFIVAESYFPDRPNDVTILAAVLAAHTLALTQLDYHLDGVEPDQSVPQTAAKLSAESAVVYAIRMVYAAGQLAGDSAGKLFRDALDPISGFVVERMHEDWLSTHRVPADSGEAKVLAGDYLSEPTSRLLASGYWEVMTRAAFVAHDRQQPEDVTRYIRYVRRLRQLADEVRDIDEDIRTGIITLPVLLHLADNDGCTLEQLRTLEQTASSKRDDLVRAIGDSVRTAAVAERVVEIARQISVEPPIACSSRTGPPPLSVLADIKLAVLETTLSGWIK